MEYQKTTNLLGTTLYEVPKFITTKWIELHDQSGSTEDRYKPSKQTRFKTSMLRLDPCGFSDAYIVVKGTITVKAETYEHEKYKSLVLKCSAPYISCISKISNTKDQ